MNQLERNVLTYIGEDPDNPDVFTDDSTGMAQIRESLNDALEEISALTGGYKREYHLPLTANAGFYRMKWTGGSFAWVTDAWLVRQRRRLERTDITRLNNFNPWWMRTIGPPYSYFTIGTDIIGIWPKPSESSGLLTLTCVTIPNRYTTDTDRIVTRDDWQWAAVFYAVSEYWASRGDAKAAVGELDKYIERMGLQDVYPQAAEYVPGLRAGPGAHPYGREPWPKATD